MAEEKKEEVWEGFFERKQIAIREVPFGLPALAKPSAEDVAIAQKDFEDVNFLFPSDYSNFCVTYGGGTLGRVRIFLPNGRFMTSSDLRFHTFRLRDKFAQSEFIIAHSFPLQELIPFASDIIEDVWFGWKSSDVGENAGKIYCFHEHSECPPPVCISKSFSQFINEVALGNKLRAMGIRKWKENQDNDNYDDESDDESDEDDDEDGEGNSKKPPLLFTPFPGSRF